MRNYVAPSLNNGLRKKKVSFIHHKLAELVPGFAGEPEYMESEEPQWLTKIKTKFRRKTDKLVPTKDETPSTIIATNNVVSDGKESLWERFKSAAGL